jgi:predicted kinase
LLDHVALFGELARELGVARAAFPFRDDHSRFRYFRDERRTRHDVQFDDTRNLVTVLVGFPASGKDTWCRAHAGDALVVSLDQLRAEHGLSHEGSQTRVADLATEQMRVALRKRQPVVWNATNLVSENRNGIIDVADAYGARVRVVVFEAAPETLRARNRERAQPVPEDVFARMAARWEMPTRADAHVLDIVET